MNRRHFLAASAGIGATRISAADLYSLAEEKEEKKADAVFDHDKVDTTDHFTATARKMVDGECPDIQLEVLIASDPENPGSGVKIKKFQLTWEKKDVPIPANFWNDLKDWDIQTYPNEEREKLPYPLRSKLDAHLQQLRQPRVILSSKDDTVMIEWERGELSCKNLAVSYIKSTTRWIVSKDGTVLRHCDRSPGLD